MIFDAVERAYLVLGIGTTNKFTTDLAALIAAKGVAGLDSTISVYKRERAETFIALGGSLPGLGVYGTHVDTQARVGGVAGVGWRDNVSLVTYDYYCVYTAGADAPVKAAKQAELAAEALLKCIDAMVDTPGDGVFGAGELRASVQVEMSDGYLKDAAGWFRRAKVTFPLTDRDDPV